MKKQNHLFLFILAGGSGERFWPLSRTQCPKHLLTLFSKKTLLEETLQRIQNLVPKGNIFILTNRKQKSLIQKKLPYFSPKQIIVEPEKRDTAPAAALATAIALQKQKSAVVGLLPADHYIKSVSLFKKNVMLASQTALQNDALITLGIPPTYAATGYGYLKCETKKVKKGQVYPVTQFLEKPKAPLAQKFLKDKKYFWNAGLFFWRGSYFLEECQSQAPDLARFIRKFPKANINSYLKREFPRLTQVSLDYAIAEKAKHVMAVIAEFDWNDVGSWEALTSHFSTDKQNNIFLGKGLAVNSTSNLVISHDKYLVLHEVKDLIVIVDKDAILISHRNQAQSIKKILSRLPKELI